MSGDRFVCFACGRKGTRGFSFMGTAGQAPTHAQCTNKKACAKREKQAEKRQGWT